MMRGELYTQEIKTFARDRHERAMRIGDRIEKSSN